MGSGGAGLLPPLFSKPVLLVPPRAADHQLNLRPDRGGAAGAPDGEGGHPARVLPGAEVGVHAQPGAVQCEGARPDHHPGQLRRRQSLLHPPRHRRQGILPAGAEFLGGVDRGGDDAGFGVWMGGDFPTVLGGARFHVVAPKSRSSLFVQVRASPRSFLPRHVFESLQPIENLKYPPIIA